ncbi:(S)-ureidoglycine aminohydrolase [Clostridium tyrobutyricum]|uniref:(S)-ureidoglycine aminohydrolase n=1 Tax=Clostridium tyrobutyricum TaxID=1519 RepID=UPI0030CC7CC9
MGYPNDVLSTRAILKKGVFAVIPPDGLVNNVIPGIEGCKVSIIASPKMGASFVQYVVDAEPQGKTTKKFGSEKDIETFIYCIKGNIKVKVNGEEKEIVDGGYAYSPAGVGLEFENTSNQTANLLLYKQIYIPLEGHNAKVVWGNVNKIEYKIYDGMENVFVKDLLPTDLGFDMNMHILSFAPGGCHPFVETHVQEHGSYTLEGEGVYLLDDKWMTIKKGDYIWFGPYVAQAAYGVGRENFTYIYSKDCNRDVIL